MKKILAVLLALLFLLLPLTVQADGGYTLIALPEIEESEWPAEIFCAHVMRVEVDRQVVENDNFLRVYLNLPYSASQVYDILLTDGYTWVHADMEQFSHSLRLVFDASLLRDFRDGAWTYLVVVAIV